jgi:hypothetical protein
MYKCCFPGCDYETENRSLIEYHHVHLREAGNRLGKNVTIPLCAVHHNLIYHEDATAGQHAERHPDSMIVKQVATSNRGKCVIFEDMEGVEHVVGIDETPSNAIHSIRWDILRGILAEEYAECPEAIATLVDSDGFYDDVATVYYRDGFEKVAKTLLAKHIEHYMKEAKSEFDLAIEKSRSDWTSLRSKA